MILRIFFFVVLVLCPPSFLQAKEGIPETLLRAGSDLEQGRYEEAERRLSGLKVPEAWAFWRSVLLARAKLNRGEAQEALDLLKDLLEDRPPPPKGPLNKNQGFYRRLYREALETGLRASERLPKPRTPWERRLWAYFPDAEGGAATAVPDGIGPEEKAARLHLLFEKSLFDAIPSLVTAAEIDGSDLPPQDKCRALFEWAQAHQKLKRSEEALEGYGRLQDSACDGQIRARALYWKGSIEAGLKRYAEAEKTFKSLAGISSDGRYRDDAFYRLYRIYQSQNDEQKAERALKDLTGLSQGDMKEKHLWEDGFAAYRRGDFEEALRRFDAIILMRSLGTEAQPQALYWKARTQEILSKKKLGGSSAATYRRILKTYPFSFYAVLAEARLGEAASVPSVVKAKPGFPSHKGLAEALRAVDQLNKREEPGAADVLDYLTHLYPEAASERPDAVALRWMESGDFNRALEIATEHLDKSVFDINLETDSPLTRALYPLAYAADVRRAAEANKLPLALILGIMREESLFVPDVRSHAGAVGVMQLMPATARLKARALGIPHSYGDLSVPSANIVLGSSYLKEMLGRFGNRTALAVMAYNAGPGNVAKWLRHQGDLPLDEFIESTPLTETRGYVKRVLRSAHIYAHLLGQPGRTRFFASLEPPGS